MVKAGNLFHGFTLHEEVGISGVSCDMVYENGTEVYTVEAKMSLNFKVLEQACRWRSVVSSSIVAVPLSALKGRDNNGKKNIVSDLGLGLIIADDNIPARFCYDFDPFAERNNEWNYHCQVYKFPADLEFWKSCFSRIGENECPAGSKVGKRSTTFSRTIDALKIEAEKNPDYNLKQLLVNVPTHYSNVTSAYNCIKKYSECGIIKPFWKK